MLINPDERQALPAGKHRSSVRRHRAAHEGEFTSLLVRLVPAWTIRPPRNRPPQRRDTTNEKTARSREDALSIDLRDSRQPFDQDEVALFTTDVVAEDPHVAPSSRAGESEPPPPEPSARPQVMPPRRPAPAPKPPSSGPGAAATDPAVAQPEPESRRSGDVVTDRRADPPPPVAPEPAEDQDRRPIWDPTGEHTAREKRQVPPKRRFTFADLLGFGIDTDDPIAHPTVAPPSAPDQTDLLLADPGPGDWDLLPRLSDVATAEPLRTNELVQRLWDATAEHPVSQAAATVGAPLDIQETFRTNRTFRWSVVTGALIILMLVVAGIQALGQRPVTIAEQRAVEYTDSMDRLAAGLTGFEATARTILNPATPVEELGPLTGELLSVGSLARDVAEITAEPLPEPSLLGPSTPIDRLRSPQEFLQQAAEATLTVERRLGDALTYRVLINQAFLIPELPVAASEGDLGDIGAQLSVVQASTEQVLAQLPNDPFFGTYTEGALELAAAFEEWQVAYLAALREGDVTAAGELRRDWLRELAAFRAELATPLMAVDTWAGSELARVQELLDLAREPLTASTPGA